MNDVPRNAAPPTDALEPFAAQVAHDLNNLLTGILGNLELLQHRAARGGESAFLPYIEGARSAGGRAAEFAQRLLVFSGRMAQEPAPVPVARLLRDSIEPLRGQGARITLTAPPEALHLLADPGQAEQAVLELLHNAIEAGGEGEIQVQAQAQGGLVCVQVRDAGPGMGEESIRRAGEPFFTTRGGGNGKGLGLAIVTRFLARNHGRLEFRHPPEGGCLALMYLPAAG